MIKKITLIIAAIIMSLATFSCPVLAAKNKGVETAILTDCGKSDDGVMCLLKLVVDILSIGIGILGVIGISVVGIQYLTARGSEEQVRKSKKRLLDISIGLAAYAVLYALLRWLLPTFTGI